MDWYSRSFAACAPWSYVLVLGQTMLLAMLVERSVFLMLKATLNTGAFLGQIRKLVLAGNQDRAGKLLDAAGDLPIARVCRAGLQALDRGPFELQEAMSKAVAKERPRLQRRLPQIFLLSGGLVAAGVAGTVMLGARGFDVGGPASLPFGLAMTHAPALIGGVSAAVGAVWGLFLSAKAKAIITGLDQCKQVMLELGAKQNPSY